MKLTSSSPAASSSLGCVSSPHERPCAGRNRRTAGSCLLTSTAALPLPPAHTQQAPSNLHTHTHTHTNLTQKNTHTPILHTCMYTLTHTGIHGHKPHTHNHSHNHWTVSTLHRTTLQCSYQRQSFAYQSGTVLSSIYTILHPRTHCRERCHGRLLA